MYDHNAKRLGLHWHIGIHKHYWIQYEDDM